MSYFILPKSNNIININPINDDCKDFTPYLSNSLYYYYNEIIDHIKKYMYEINLTENSFEDMIKIINPYEYIFSKVPFSKFSVSKLKPKTNLFYEFLEITTILNIFDSYKFNKINTLHITKNNTDTIECFEMLRENYKDEIKYYDEINDETIKLIGDEKFNFLFFEASTNNDLNKYIVSLMKILMIIFRNQDNNGSCIIKIGTTFNKPVIDIMYILSSLYEKTYILKPNTSNITSFDKYIICKNFQTNENKQKINKINYFKLLIFEKKLEDKNISCILDFELPYYFLTKIDDINIIIGQQQIESLDMIVNLLKNKNKEEKIEIIKKNCIQKSVAWCEKYKIPCNKFSEKTNIFLPISKEID
jgi:hypothetical protein